MYKRTKIAGILFAVLYAAAFAALLGLAVALFASAFSVSNFSVPILIIILFAIIMTVALSFLFFLPFWASVIVAKKGRKSVNAEAYRKKLPGTIAFTVVHGLVALDLSASILFFWESLYINYFIVLSCVWAVTVTGTVLIILDIVQNKKDLAKIK
jgi:hypothetical protein